MWCGKKCSILTTSSASVNREVKDAEYYSNNTESRAMAMDPFTIFMNRGKGGYGFSVSGARPTLVGRIEPGSTADQAGIEQWDQIVRINGQNVTQLDMIAVAAFVKSCNRHIVIDVLRQVNGRNPTSKCNKGVNVEFDSVSDTSSEVSALQNCSFDSDSDVTSYGAKQMPAVLGPWQRNSHASPWQLYHQLKQQQTDMRDNGDLYETESQYSYSTDNESTYSCSTFTSDKENIPTAKMMRLSNSPSPQENSAPKLNAFAQRKPIFAVDAKHATDSESNRSVLSSIRSCSPANSDASVLRRVKDKPRRSNGSDNSNHSQLSEDSGIEIASQLPVSYHNLSHNEVKRQELIHQLYESEVQLRSSLRHGVTQYLQPLQRGVVTNEQHVTLFQNIEQLLEVSSNLVKRMQASFVSYLDVLQHKHMDNIGSVFSAKIDRICIEYERYCSGVKDSLTLFMELRKIRDFDRYVKKLQLDSEKPKISNVLQKPVEHIKNVTLCMQQILKLTDTNHSDYENLQEVVRALRRCSGNISKEYIRQSQSNLTTITDSNTTLQESTPSVTSTSSVDSEVQDIQNRLLFGETVQSFDLANISRHVIYTGDLVCEVNSRFRQVHVILMNDVLLLTQRNPDNFLTVLEKPLLLQDVKSCISSSNNHPSEFQLKVECHHCETLGFEPKFYNFRASTLEQKCVWKNILEQRMNFIKTQKQFTQSRVSQLV